MSEVEQSLGSSFLGVLLLATFVGSNCLFVAPSRAAETQTYAVSFSNVKAASGEVIVSLQVKAIAGAFVGVLNLPVGWYVDINNDPSWQTEIKANTIVGAASLTPEDLRKLKFLVLKNEFGDLKFSITGDISVTKDYEKEHQLKLNMGDFAVRRMRDEPTSAE